MVGDHIDLKFDPARMKEKDKWEGTGIYIRAQDVEGRWRSEDIALLDARSLLAWLRSRGGHNPWAEDVVGILLGHGHIAPAEGAEDGEKEKEESSKEESHEEETEAKEES